MTNKKVLLLTMKIFFIILIIFALIWNHIRVQKTQASAQQMLILSYIKDHNGEVFNYHFVSANYNIRRKQIFKHLLQLEKEGKIVTQQLRLRKPVLISDNDYTNYFWRVYIASDEHPRSELGR